MEGVVVPGPSELLARREGGKYGVQAMAASLRFVAASAASRLRWFAALSLGSGDHLSLQGLRFSECIQQNFTSGGSERGGNTQAGLYVLEEEWF